MENWMLFRVLPNIEVPWIFESLSEKVAVVPYGDARANDIRARSPGAAKLWNGFRDIYGNQMEPSGLVYHQDLAETANTEEALIAFRNIVALTSALPGWADVVSHPDGTPSNPLWSDAWALYPVEVSQKETLITVNPALSVGSSPNTPFVGMPNPLIPLYRDQYQVDWPVLALLLNAWEVHYLRGQRRHQYRALFRALEVAMHALELPAYNLSSMYDFGLSLSIWVSAFEVLLHPGSGGKVDEFRVLSCLQGLKCVTPKLNHKRYVVAVRGPSRRGTWVERIYHQLYSARNAYLHGNPILKAHWHHTSGNRPTALGNLAPIVFRTALKLQLGWNVPKKVQAALEPRLCGHLWADVVACCDKLYEDALLDSM